MNLQKYTANINNDKDDNAIFGCDVFLVEWIQDINSLITLSSL